MINKKILNTFSNKRVLVTGGTGMIGRQVVDILEESGASVKVVSLDKLKLNNKASYIYGDLADFGFCKKITKGQDFVFHLAGIKGSIEVTKKRPASFFVPILMMNTNVLEACRLNGVQKVVYTSSIGAYGAGEVFKENDDFSREPMDTFPGWAKRMAELQVKAYRIQFGLNNFAVVRPCNVYGPGDNFDPANAMVIPSLMYRIYKGENPLIVWGDGKAIRDFAYSRDIAEGVILALFYGTGDGFVNLGSGRGYAIRELVATLNKFIDFEYKFDSNKPSGFKKRVMNISLAKKRIHFNPSTNLLDGLRQTWNWYIENRTEFKKKKNYFKD